MLLLAYIMAQTFLKIHSNNIYTYIHTFNFNSENILVT